MLFKMYISIYYKAILIYRINIDNKLRYKLLAFRFKFESMAAHLRKCLSINKVTLNDCFEFIFHIKIVV